MSTTPNIAQETSTGTESPARPAARERARGVEAGQGVQLTAHAAGKIKEILDKDQHPASMYLFVAVKGGGCSGLQYVLDLRDEADHPVRDTDEIYLSNDIVVVVDLKSYVAGNLEGTVIDYQEGLMGAGFTFNNPNAKHSCGCGSSYTP